MQTWRGFCFTLAAPNSAPLKASAPATLASSSVLRDIVRDNASHGKRVVSQTGQSERS